ncbi:hypothetical protein [Carnobacterium maltaromaticum]|uniref:hypothetical protein n=1 Tax=Carnobacterium maltaromaticum TaxID=2751 RepID=UPI00295F463C|nr:hypothetical protein [Carnobacterium maltaromaticum]
MTKKDNLTEKKVEHKVDKSFNYEAAPRENRNGIIYDSMSPEVKSAYDASLQNKKDNASNR